MSHPYRSQPPRAFWSAAVPGGRAALDIYRPRAPLDGSTRIATAGSCFARHIGRWLRTAGLAVLDAEPLPATVPQSVAARYGYGLFSARFGNVYTARQMAELLAEVADGAAPLIWQNAGRFRDALRPTVEPEGLDSAAEVALHRALHLERVARMLGTTDLFVLTLGLTEAWQDRDAGRTLPLCPGVAGGTFDPTRHRLAVFRTAEVLADLHSIRALLHRFNPGMRIFLTVSPVGLAATATGDHVLTATAASKATLRAAVAEFVADVADADYFPSLEIATHPAFGGPFPAPGLREISGAGVARVMEVFFAAHGLAEAPAAAPLSAPEPIGEGDTDTTCDERLLEAFGG